MQELAKEHVCIGNMYALARGKGGGKDWVEVGKSGGLGGDGDIYNRVNNQKVKNEFLLVLGSSV